MRYRLHADVVLTAGSGAKPIILVSRSSGRRVDLTEEQAAIAVLLTGGASWEQLVDEARRCGLDWQGQKLHDYISLLMVQDLLTVTQDAATQDIAAAAEPADEDVGYEEDQDTVVSDLLVADDEDEAGEADEEEDEQTVVEGFDILEAHAAFAPAAEHAPATDEVPQQLPHAPPGQP
ncbi:MAG: hypothetical protein KC503_46985, partial [Myxococcales bacterium]|nr:hypothetical protein [Myxococcales bacterium]